jgi:protocatechuate 3,4-dioxygenase beta subunit
VVLARDGATVSARVTDKDGAPVRDIPVLLLPVDAATPAVVQAAMVTGATDQQGQYTSQTIAPGKYYVVATDSRIDATPECIDRLWRSRNKFTETSIAPNAATQLTLTPVTL